MNANPFKNRKAADGTSGLQWVADGFKRASRACGIRVFSVDGLDQISNPTEKYAAVVSTWVYHAVIRERKPEKSR